MVLQRDAMVLRRAHVFWGGDDAVGEDVVVGRQPQCVRVPEIVDLCVCVCEREREREGGREGGRERGREGERESHMYGYTR
jgi:hypothetical protein